MRPKVFASIVVVLLLAATISPANQTAATRGQTPRDEALFLEAAKSFGRNECVQGRMLLDTLIYTYPDSPLTAQAKVLIFYSYAVENSGQDAAARDLLKRMDGYLGARHPRPRVP